MRQFQGMIAEYERAQIAERTRRGKLHRARTGPQAVMSGAPYGYRYVKKTEHIEGFWEIDEAQAQVVREVFDRYINDGASIGELARWLTERGVPTRTGKAVWDRSTSGGCCATPPTAGRPRSGRPRRRPARQADAHHPRRAASATAAGRTRRTSRPRSGR